jgi:hypothetical protein
LSISTPLPTHRKVQLPVRTELFTPCTASLLGQDVTVLDPRILLHLYGTVGVTRRKDRPRITALAQAIASGTVATKFTDQDCQAFTSFMLARTRRYRCFFAAKRAWTILLDTLPPGVSQALRHHVQMPANDVFRLMNRRGQCRQVRRGPGRAWRAARRDPRRTPARAATAPCLRTARSRFPP